MEKKIGILLFSLVLLAPPMIVLAAGVDPFANPIPPVARAFNLWTDIIIPIFNFIWPVFVGIAIIMFIFAGFTFVTAAGDPGKIKLARDATVWGLLGVVVGLLAFSIPFLIQNSLGI